MTTSPIAVQAPGDDGVALLTLQRPEKRNALSIALRDSMSDALDALAKDATCRVVVVTGAGEAFSAGFDLAVMCDVREAADTARFGHPEHTFAEVVYAPLHDLVGGSIARDLALTGRRIDAEEARALGLLTRVVAPGQVLDEARVIAAEIAGAPRDVLLRMKAKILRRARIEPGATLDL